MDKKILVVYKSVTGFTRDYAQAIAKALDGEAVPLKQVKPAQLNGCQVIFGGRFHAGSVDGLKKFKVLCSRPAAVFGVGAMPAAMEDTITAAWGMNLTPEELEAIPHFYFQGGLRYEKMPLGEKLLMKAFAAMMRNKKDKDSSEQEAAQDISHSFDCYDEKNILPLVELLKNKKSSPEEEGGTAL